MRIVLRQMHLPVKPVFEVSVPIAGLRAGTHLTVHNSGTSVSAILFTKAHGVVGQRWDPEHATDALQLRSVAILYVRKDAAGDNAGVRYALAR